MGFIIGTVLGSFVEAVSNRLIKQTSILGRSYCEKCRKTLAWYDLFPVVSYLLLKGRCRYCQKKIPRQALIVEAGMGLAVALLFALTAPRFEMLVNFNQQTLLLGLELFFKLFVVSILAIVFLVDLRTGYIFDKVTYPAVALSGLFLIISTAAKSWFFYQDSLSSSLGKYFLPPYSNYVTDIIQRMWLAVGWSFLSAVALALIFVLLILITRGKGMGWGDVKYVLFLGLALGFPNNLVGIFLAFFLGAIVSVFLIAFGKKHFGQTIPFGPFLSLGAYLALLFGPQVLNSYLSSFKLGY